ncbi:hypothetical protein [Halalkalibacter okhensis]|uniref:Uncharacterized protein n=1 Tax=Halalkalibacter okhensis TaxID=333138 RepID=A0A0B0IL47_9BACI|nr:hypothetical protein [Halalkalibacter okhensis]KHF41622.1 hypothetical protein LQ50_02655 [Halalkalibacter okhensis]
MLRNTDFNTLFPYLATSGMLLLVTSFFVPIVAIIFIQDWLFFSVDHWSFIRPKAAYIGFGAGMVWTAIVLFSLLLTKVYSEKRDRTYKLTWLHLLFLGLAVILFVCSITHYAYLDEDGVKKNSFWTLSEDRIEWDDVLEVTRVVDESTKRVTAYSFSDGNLTITIPYDSQDYLTVQSIKYLVDTYNWDIVDVVE